MQPFWALEQKIKILFDEWQIGYLPLNTLFSELSGDEQTKIQIIKAIVTQADVILLDEPSNYLDIRSLEAIEEILELYEGALIVISHDEEFLKKLNIVI